MNSPSSKIDLLKGLSIYAICNISSKQKREGRKVIIEFAETLTPVRFTIGLNNENNLAVWIIDNDKKVFTSEELKKSSFLDKETLILVSIHEVREGEYKITIMSFYDREAVVCNANLNITGEKFMEFSVGATVNGTENAAFSLKELIIRNIIDKDHDLDAIVQYLDKKHTLEHV